LAKLEEILSDYQDLKNIEGELTQEDLQEKKAAASREILGLFKRYLKKMKHFKGK